MPGVTFDGYGRATGLLLPALGECRLSLVSGNLVLKRHKGRLININGRYEEIPAAGVSLAATGTAGSVPYNIYAYMDVLNTMQLEWSATAHVEDANTGVRIKSGDPSRSLVGKACCAVAGTWVDSDTYRWVLNWFNPRKRKGVGGYAVQRNWSSTVYTELDAGLRIHWLSWGGEAASLNIIGATYNNTVGAINITAFAFNSLTQNQQGVTHSEHTNGGWMGFGMSMDVDCVEGVNYMTALAWANAGTGTWSLSATASFDQ